MAGKQLKPVKVVATQRGYYGQLIEPGELFEIADESHLSKRWMKPFDSKQDATAKPVRRRVNRKASKVIPQEPEALADATPDDGSWAD